MSSLFYTPEVPVTLQITSSCFAVFFYDAVIVLQLENWRHLLLVLMLQLLTVTNK